MDQTNKLQQWFALKLMTKQDFAEAIGVTPAYVSQLTRDWPPPPWPGREIARLIGEVTKGRVTPNDLAGYSDGRRLARVGK